MTRLLLLRLAASSSLLCAFQCERPYEGPDIDFGPGTGITQRDAQGHPTALPDPTDWTSDATWNAQELSRYDSPRYAINGPQQPAAVSSLLTYPNPAPAGQVTWRLKLSPTAPCPCHVVAQLVTKRYTEADEYSATLAAGDSLQFAPKAYDPGQLYRLYYLVYNDQVLLYKGHGDIRFTP